MLSYALKRTLLAVPTLLIVSLIIFVIMRLVPGDPTLLLVSDLQDMSALEEMRQELGLDDPLPVQFFDWLSAVLSGNLGTSIMTGEPVLEAMITRFGVTAEVVLVSIVVASLIAIPGGMLAAWRQDSRLDFGILLFIVLSLSVPSFWAGLVLLMVFGAELQWFPTVGFVSVTQDVVRGLHYLVLPVTALVFVEMATIARMMRSSTIEILRQEYITHARAKGLSETVVLWKHAFPNGFAPTITVVGLTLGSLLGGATVTENVFTLPGIGRFVVEAIYARDYPVVQGTMLLVAAVYVLMNLFVDLLYPVFDPRVKL